MATVRQFALSVRPCLLPRLPACCPARFEAIRTVKMSAEQPGDGQTLAAQQPLVMQLIVDRTIATNPEWGRGPLMAQAAHAAMAVAVKTASHPLTQEYTSASNLAHMHKIVLRNGDKQTLQAISEQLDVAREGLTGAEKDAFPEHVLWIEQPENIPTVLAVAPNRKPPALKKILNKCSLLRD